MISPTRPRWTASGFRMMSVFSMVFASFSRTASPSGRRVVAEDQWDVNG
jgi:hypothetical protein